MTGRSHRPKCGARTRQGTPCQCQVLPGKTRCKLHGGMSTGPKTAGGIQRIREAQRLRAFIRRRACERSDWPACDANF